MGAFATGNTTGRCIVCLDLTDLGGRAWRFLNSRTNSGATAPIMGQLVVISYSQRAIWPKKRLDCSEERVCLYLFIAAKKALLRATPVREEPFGSGSSKHFVQIRRPVPGRISLLSPLSSHGVQHDSQRRVNLHESMALDPEAIAWVSILILRSTISGRHIDLPS